MRFIFKTIQKTIPPLAFLLLLIFTSCSLLGLEDEGYICFSIDSARSILSTQTDDLYFIDVELKGGYEAIQTLPINRTDDKLSVVFENVTAGANVYVEAQVYTVYQGEKAVIYQGRSETKTIEEGENAFALKLENVYNTEVQAPYSCLILRPLFTSSTTDDQLTSNKLNYVNGESGYYWQYDNLRQYQKARITFRRIVSEAQPDAQGQIAFSLAHSTENNSINLDTKEASAEPAVYEFQIPTTANFDRICMYNSLPDFSYTCVVEKIELLTIGSFDIGSGNMNLPGSNIEVLATVNDSDTPLTPTNGLLSIGRDKTLTLRVTSPAAASNVRYTWKVNTVTDETHSGSGTSYSSFEIVMSELSEGETYDITVLVDSDTIHESWSIQLKIDS